jgi:molybdate transport system regulatory protein
MLQKRGNEMRQRTFPKACVMHLHLRLETDNGLAFGPGRAPLLENIERLGSLSKAAKELGMGYRAAWGKIRRTEEVLGFKLIETGGNYKEGCRLTRAGKELMERFHRWRQEVEEDALQKARVIFLSEATESEEQGREHGPSRERRFSGAPRQ